MTDVDATSSSPLRDAQARERRATLAAVGSICIWCWSAVCFARGARLLGPMPYLTLMTATGTVTAACLHFRAHGNVRGLIRIPFRVVLVGFWGVSFYTVILVAAIGLCRDEDVGQVSLLNYLWPVWVVLLSCFLLDDRPRLLPTFAGAFLGLAGVIGAKGLATFTHPPDNLLPHALALAAGLLWAVYCILLRRWRVPDDQAGTTVNFAMCTVLAAVVGVVRGEWQACGHFSGEALFWVLFGGIGPVGLAYHGWELGVKRGNVRLISLLAYFIPIGAAVLIGLFCRESMSTGLIPGACLVAAGAWLGKRGET